MAVTDIEGAIYYLLAADATVSGLVGTRIYPNLVPQAASLPAITYQQISGVREHTADGADGIVESRFQINCWASTYTGAKSLSDAVRKELDGYKGTVGSRNILFCFLADEDDMPQIAPETDVLQRYGKRLDFIFMYDEALS